MDNKLNFLFKPGKITTLMDGSFGSSGKGKMSSYIAEHSNNWTFACNAFAPQAGHWVVLSDGRKFFYQTLNSCAYLPNQYEKIYIGPGGMIELAAFFREMEENKIPHSKIGISPAVAILQDKDGAFERGQMDLDGNLKQLTGTTLKGSTCHGVGACTVRKVLRRSDALYAKDVPELKEFICNVPEEIMARLSKGESGFGEIAQGFPLSLNHQYFTGYTTSRNVTVSQFMSDMFLPTKYAGPVVINFRTFPIRINSNKYIGKDGKFLTWADIDAGVPYNIIRGDSGRWYPDQTELTWDEVTSLAQAPKQICEITSETKLPRRVATFSKQCLEEAIRYNDTNNDMWITINFMNYVDSAMTSKNKISDITPQCGQWIKNNIQFINKYPNVDLLLLGTGAATDDIIDLHDLNN
jgi:adenylosuccinate synthase